MKSLEELQAHELFHYNKYIRKFSKKPKALLIQGAVDVKRQQVSFQILSTSGLLIICHNLNHSISTFQKVGRPGLSSRYLNPNNPGPKTVLRPRATLDSTSYEGAWLLHFQRYLEGLPPFPKSKPLPKRNPNAKTILQPRIQHNMMCAVCFAQHSVTNKRYPAEWVV
jgi:hypothetical protein